MTYDIDIEEEFTPLPTQRAPSPGISSVLFVVVPGLGQVYSGRLLAGALWLWVSRDIGKCLLAMALTLLAWLAAINTANDVISTALTSELWPATMPARWWSRTC